MGQRGERLPGQEGSGVKYGGRGNGAHFRTISPTPGMAAERLSGPGMEQDSSQGNKKNGLLILSHASVVIISTIRLGRMNPWLYYNIWYEP